MAIRLWGAWVLLMQLMEEPKCVQGGTEKTLMKPLVMEFFSLKPFKMSKEKAWAHTFLVMVIAGLSRLCGFVTLTPVIVVS